MASKVQIELVDDLDSGPATGTVRFGLDGKNYEIDLSDQNTKELREGLADYIAAARPASSTPKPTKVAAAGTPVREIRAWAAANGYELSNRGKIPYQVRAAYETAHSAKG